MRPAYGTGVGRRVVVGAISRDRIATPQPSSRAVRAAG
jgi:hypothetical protein